MTLPLVIAPSILAADFANLGEEVRAMTAAGADWLHWDVMDGHYVPNISFGAPVIKALRQHSDLPFDVHLMVSPVNYLLESIADAGANLISIHPEAEPHPHRTLQTIKKLGCQTGVVLNPGTPVQVLDHLLDITDLVLVMTVNPGFGGQAFIPLYDKIKEIRRRITASARSIRLEIDGGVNIENASKLIAAGADTLVVGTALFKAPPYAQTIQQLRGHK